MKLGNTGAYITDAPIQRNDVGIAMTQAEDAGFKHRAEEFVRFKAKKEQDDKYDEAAFKDMPKAEYTRDADKNKFLSDGFTDATKVVYDAYSKFKSGQLSWPEFNRTKQNTLNALNHLNEGAKKTEAYYTGAAKDIADGKVHPLFQDQIMKTGEAMDNIRLKFNPDGTAHGYAMSPDGKEVVYDSPLNAWGTNFQQYNHLVDLNTLDKNFVTANPMPVTERFNGYMKTGTTNISEQIKNNIKSEVQSRMGNPDIVAQVASEMYKKPITRVTDAAELQKVAQKMEDDLLNSYSKSTKKDFDSGQAGYYQGVKEFNIGRKDKEEEKLKNAPVDVKLDDTTFTEDIMHIKDEKGNVKKVKVTKDGVYQNGLNYVKPIAIVNSGGTKSGMDNMSVNSAFINKDGRVVVTGSVIDKKGETIKNDDGTITYAGTGKAFTRLASEETLAAMAKAGNFFNKKGKPDTEAFKNHLKEKNREEWDNDHRNATREEYDKARGDGKKSKPASNIDEKKIQYLMKQNKGATRQQIIDALTNQQ